MITGSRLASHDKFDKRKSYLLCFVGSKTDFLVGSGAARSTASATDLSAKALRRAVGTPAAAGYFWLLLAALTFAAFIAAV